MSMLSHDAAFFQSAAALPPLAFDDRSFQHPDEGYAFETALCLVESQSPSLRPVSDALRHGASATIEGRETQALLDRVNLLEKLLAGVRDHLGAAEWRTLLDAADRVTGELKAALAADSERCGVQFDVRRYGNAEIR